MLNQTLSLAWQLFRHETRTAKFRVLFATQLLITSFIVTLTLSSASIQQYLSHNIAHLLGADAVFSQKGRLALEQFDQLERFGDEVIFTQSVKTTLTHADKWQPITLKGVDRNYPLQGQLQIADNISSAPYAIDRGPEKREIWLGSRLLAELSLKMGERLSIADMQFTVSKVLHHEPDRLMEGHNVDMRALIHQHDFSRLGFADDTVSYRYLLNMDASNVDNLIAWQRQAAPAAQVRHQQGAHPLALFWKRTENFFGLASVLLLFMAAIAIHQIARMQVTKEQTFSAVCMSVGASRYVGLKIAIAKWIINMLLLFPAVLIVSSLCHWAIVHWLSSTLLDLRWKPDVLGVFTAFTSVALLLAMFQLPTWLALQQASVKQLIFNRINPGRKFISLCCALSVLVAVTVVYSDNGLLTAMMLSAMAVCIVIILGVSWLGLTVGETLTQRVSGLLPFAMFMMKQRLVSKSTQIMGVGLCAFLLLFTLMLMRDLGNTMHGYQRQYDGNLFVSQASNAEMQSVTAWISQHNAELRQRKPFMYASLVRINNATLDEYTDTPSDSLATFQRAIRLHWTESVPNNNRLVNGQWWGANETQWQQVSVEQEVMTDLGLSIGDRLSFQVGDQIVDFAITASHAYRPGAGSITFWVQMPSTAVPYLNAPHYFMASVEANDRAMTKLPEIWQQHPSIRMVTMQEMVKRFDNTLGLVTQVISGFSFLIVLLAIIVIVASVLSYEVQERKKNSLIMSFGLTKRTCLNINIMEWSVTGVIAAVGAILGTWLAGVLIYQSQFSLTYQPDFVWLSATLFIIMLVVVGIGHMVSRNSLSSSIRELLAE